MIKHSTWLKHADVASEESKCVSLHVGCVLVLNDHMISTGVNGTPKGFTNCCEIFDERGPKHTAWSDKHEIHAEMNAIIHCPVSTVGSTAYVNESPCYNCCKHLIGAGIIAIHFSKRYYRMTDKEFDEIISFCTDMNVKLYEKDTRYA